MAKPTRKNEPRMGLTVNSSERRRHLANGIVIAGFFPLDLGFLVSSGFLGFSQTNLGLFRKITVATVN